MDEQMIATEGTVNEVEVGRSPPLDPSYWLVAVIDLLGQQEAFLKTDFIPTNDEEAKPFIAALQASLGVVRGMRKNLALFRDAYSKENEEAHAGLTTEQRAYARKLKQRQVQLRPMSDAMMLTCTLKPNEGHVIPMMGVYDVLVTCMNHMLMQLAIGYPIRGGLDVGTGLVVDGEFFGAALVKAYRLENKAEHPRLVVGDELVRYLTISAGLKGASIERQMEAKLGAKCLTFLIRDQDEKWILDYAGPGARSVLPSQPSGEIVARARAFAQASRTGFQKDSSKLGRILFERYSKLVRYLDSRAALWT
jgi:hypothetical protein